MNEDEDQTRSETALDAASNETASMPGPSYDSRCKNLWNFVLVQIGKCGDWMRTHDVVLTLLVLAFQTVILFTQARIALSQNSLQDTQFAFLARQEKLAQHREIIRLIGQLRPQLARGSSSMMGEGERRAILDTLQFLAQAQDASELLDWTRIATDHWPVEGKVADMREALERALQATTTKVFPKE